MKESERRSERTLIKMNYLNFQPHLQLCSPWHIKSSATTPTHTHLATAFLAEQHNLRKAPNKVMDPDALREGAFGYSSFGQLQLTEETQKSTAQNIPTVPKLLEDMDAPVTAADFKAQELLYMVLGELRDALSSPSHDHLKNMNNRKLADALSIGNRGPLDPELRSRMRGFVWEMRAGYYKDEDLQRLKRRTNFVLRCIERITGYSTELSLVRVCCRPLSVRWLVH